ncbi:hypothetical protein CO046_02040 [Candidatus Peregrinibacteria bacterium CG_4_9_14_0_2_um_filter_53_11]|nr:MAG: hypothetical protein CO046_02040 [Candidatus Peregrinibacteria bacterium CG_4_9_14_0_2_um_filter_53_11]
MSLPRTAIIGGRGKLGAAFAGLFEKAGCEVLIADHETELTPRQACAQADITIFSVPISVTPAVINEVAPAARPGSLLADLTSIKLPAMEALARSAPDGVEILGLHPLFGPQVVSHMAEQVIAVCPLKTGPRAEWLSNFLVQNGAHLKKTTPQEHDEMMAVIQGITHFSAIASGLALKKLGVDLEKTLAFASPIYELRLAMIGRILGQSPQLYAEIQIENPSTAVAVKAYKQAIDELSQTVDSSDEQAFQTIFREAADYLGSFKERASQMTDHVIDSMAAFDGTSETEK